MSSVTRNVLYKCISKDCTKCSGRKECSDKPYDIQNTVIDRDANECCIATPELYMAIAKVNALFSHDPSTKVGACLVDKFGKIVGYGCNNMPSDSKMYPWSREGQTYETKYPYVIHAEMTCIVQAKGEGKVLYTTHFPCSNCAKHIVLSGIKKVVFLDYFRDMADIEIAKNIFSIEGIEIIKFSDLSNIANIELNFDI